MKRMFIVGEDAFLVTAMRVALRYTPDLAVFGVRSQDGSVRRAVRDARPDIVLMDGSADERTVLARLAQITEERTDAIVLVLAAALDAEILDQLLDAGATVCLSRTPMASRIEALLNATVDAPPRVPAAAREVDEQPTASPAAPDRPALTSRELEILRCVAKGHTNARIGRDLWVTEQTVKFHLSNVYRKLGVSNRTEASRYAFVNDLVPGTGPSRRARLAGGPDGGAGSRIHAGRLNGRNPAQAGFEGVH